MKEIIVWNDFCLNESFSDELDTYFRQVFSNDFDGCHCRYLGRRETREWIASVPCEPGISIGKRPISIWRNDLPIHQSRLFDNNRKTIGYYFDMGETADISAKFHNQDTIIIHEDAIVGGDSLVYLLDRLKEQGYLHSGQKIEVYCLGAVKSGIEHIRENYGNVNINAYCVLMSNEKINWNSTVLFLSDMYEKNQDGNMFLEDSNRFKQCFYSHYEEVKIKCRNVMGLL